MSKAREPEDKHVIVANNEEDFTEWEWGDKTDAVREAAARLVLSELIAGAHFQLDIYQGTTIVEFASFDFQLMLKYPLAEMVTYWLDGYVWAEEGGDCIADEEGREGAAALIRDLKAAAARLQEALDRPVPQRQEDQC